MAYRENSNVVRFDPVEHGVRPPRGRQDELGPYMAADSRRRFGELTNQHDRGFDCSRKLEASARLLGFESIDGGLEFLLS
jgi:hypothetical protein